MYFTKMQSELIFIVNFQMSVNAIHCRAYFLDRKSCNITVVNNARPWSNYSLSQFWEMDEEAQALWFCM